MRGKRAISGGWLRMIGSFAWLAMVGVAGVVGAGEGVGVQREPPSLRAVRVQLLQNETGTLSGDALQPGFGDLVNMVAGPDSINAALVWLEISGPPLAVYNGRVDSDGKYAVRLVATDLNRGVRLLDQRQEIPVLSDE